MKEPVALSVIIFDNSPGDAIKVCSLLDINYALLNLLDNSLYINAKTLTYNYSKP